MLFHDIHVANTQKILYDVKRKKLMIG